MMRGLHMFCIRQSTVLRKALAAVALAGVLASPHSTEAAAYDPDLTWRTLTTEHFRIHFHQGEEQLAEEFSTTLETVYTKMTDELRWKPRRKTELVLIDRTDQANGYAVTVPYNAIVIYVTAPQEGSTLSRYEDWGDAISTHEMTHILHIDTNHGLARLVRWVVGRVSSTNRVSPLWMVEGLATFQETRHTSGGRGRTPYVDMIKRAAALEDAWPPLGNLDGIQPKPPAGNLRYLFGQDLISFVADERGANVWTRWIHHYGGSFPYILPGKAIFGESLTRLYRRWRADRLEKYAAQAESIREEGLREGRVVSDPRANCIAPSFAPDGDKLVWSCVDLRRGAAIWMSDGEGYGAEILLQDRGAKNFTWRNDSRAFVFAATHTVNRFNTWSDIYLHTLGSSGVSALTGGARARDPDFSPDGSRLAMVTNRAQDTNLEVMTVDKQRVALTDRTDHTQFATPRYSPDGRALAVSVWSAGRRDLWIYDTEGSPARRLTMDVAIDEAPRWSADGRTLYFASDRTGVPNIFAIDVETERLWQVTNVLTGATNPSVNPSEDLLAYQRYTEDGWEVHLLDIDRTKWLDRGVLPLATTHRTPLKELVSPVTEPQAVAEVTWTGRPPARFKPGAPADPLPFAAHWQEPGEAVDSFDFDEVGDVFGEERDYPFTIKPRRYNPLPTLLPRYWLPNIQTTTTGRFEPRALKFLPLPLLVSVSSGASDPLRHFGWSATGFYRNDANFVGGAATLTYNRWIPVYSLSGSRVAVPYALRGADPERIDPETGEPAETVELYWERRQQLTASVSYPYTARMWIFGSYNLQFRDPLHGLPSTVPIGSVPARGTLGSLQGGWRYSWSQPTPYSISPEDARIVSVVGGLYSPWLGSFVQDANGDLQPLTQVQFTAELREYLVNPWIPNHVLALRLAGGITVGNADFLGTYSLGGSFGDGAFYSTPDQFRMLRGYPLGSDIGDAYWLGGVEYRFPIVRFDRGFGLMPGYLRALSGVVFADTGNAYTDIPSSAAELGRGTLLGTGAELRLSTVVGWAAGLTARAGYAVGWTENGIPPDSPETFYFQLGGSF